MSDKPTKKVTNPQLKEKIRASYGGVNCESATSMVQEILSLEGSRRASGDSGSRTNALNKLIKQFAETNLYDPDKLLTFLTNTCEHKPTDTIIDIDYDNKKVIWNPSEKKTEKTEKTEITKITKFTALEARYYRMKKLI